jgi:hypothetical protein
MNPTVNPRRFAPAEPARTCLGRRSAIIGLCLILVAGCRFNDSDSDGWTVGGTVSGLALSESVVLQNNGADDLTVSGDGPFSFSTPASQGSSYIVTVMNQPEGQTCSVSSGAGTVSGADITDVAVDCVTHSYTVTPGGDGHESISPLSAQTIDHGSAATFTVIADTGYTVSTGVGGTCPAGSWAGNQYTTGAITSACTVSFSATFNTATLSASLSNLALSVSGLTLDGDPSGKARIITITNTGAFAASGLTVDFPTFPAGTSASSNCSAVLNAGSSCAITITPGASETSDCSAGIAATPGVIDVSADNGNSVSTGVVVLTYGCIYQEGYVFSMDDSTPATSSIGGTVAALEDQADSLVWGSNGVNAGSVSYDIVPGIGNTSTASSGTPTFQDASAYFQATYTGPFGLSASDFSQCDGITDGRCNTANIVAFYDYYQTNYGLGAAPYTPVVAATPKADYAAGVCDDYDSGTYQDWYLPAACQLTYDDPNIRPDIAGCGLQSSPLMQNVQQNLFLRSVGNITTGERFWSSTEYIYFNPEIYAWNALMWPSSFPAGGGDKSDLAQVRCVRDLTEP